MRDFLDGSRGDGAGAPYQTPMVAGIGTTCGAAWTDAELKALQLALAGGCFQANLTCNFTLVASGSCFTNSQGQQQINAYGRYNCAPCIDVSRCV